MIVTPDEYRARLSQALRKAVTDGRRLRDFPPEWIGVLARLVPDVFDRPGFVDWKRDSLIVALHAPSQVGPEFDWEGYSWAVAQYCPERLDPDRYNWKDYSWAVAQYCPERLDPDRYNWKDHSAAVLKYCPDMMDPERISPDVLTKARLSFITHLDGNLADSLLDMSDGSKDRAEDESLGKSKLGEDGEPLPLF